MNNSCFEAFSSKLFRCTVSPVACTSKDDRLSCSPNQVDRDVDSFTSVNTPEMVLETSNVRCFWSNFMTDRIRLIVAGKCSNVFV